MNKEIINIVDQVILKHGKTVNQVIPILQAIQDEFNYLPEEALEHVCNNTEISAARIYGVSTFYSQFRHKPVGKHIIKICVGTACHVKGAMQVYDAYRRELNIVDEHEDTDPEGLFTIDKVACLGCCTIAPVVQIDDITYGHLTIDKVSETISDFKSAKDNPKQAYDGVGTETENLQGEIRLGLGSCCVASGSSLVKDELEGIIANSKINVNVKQVGCVGICNQVPMLEIHKPGESPTFYTKIKAEEVSGIIRKHFKPRNIFDRLRSDFFNYFEGIVFNEIPKATSRYESDRRDTPISEFLNGQINIATEYRGVIKPTDLEEYKNLGGFSAFKKCITQSPKEIIATIKRSGLKGRGGAGFLTGLKWEIVENEVADIKYIICNGDEGDPGAFMDRMLLESYPFRVIEGMLIAAYAVGASEGLFYIRAEYPLAVKRINEALQLCKEEGLIGERIFNSDFSFNLEMFEGAGAFVCGEETALIASVEGNRGMPRMRPPFPAHQGLWNKPTLINNTETFSLVSWILRNGADAFSKIGSENSKGTKVFALAGKINRGGLIEVPMGISVNTIVEKIGGGIPNGKKFKAVQIGGPSGGCIPASMADISIDYESLDNAGAMMGSGGLIVLDEDDCMVDIARYFLSFTQDQSCGKCTFCRIGTTRMLDILNKISRGEGKMEDLDLLEKLAKSTKKGSLCGLGRSAPNPVLSTLTHFRAEYEEHINGKCPTGKCTEMITYTITDDCNGCTKCAQKCPTDAIETRPYQLHEIDTEKCIKCDICKQVCPIDAVITI